MQTEEQKTVEAWERGYASLPTLRMVDSCIQGYHVFESIWNPTLLVQPCHC